VVIYEITTVIDSAHRQEGKPSCPLAEWPTSQKPGGPPFTASP
jgi:hypothetical protein